MKNRRGVNPDYADFDELDIDALDAQNEFENGRLTIDELRAHIGSEAVMRYMEDTDEDYDFDYTFFDDPEEF